MGSWRSWLQTQIPPSSLEMDLKLIHVAPLNQTNINNFSGLAFLSGGLVFDINKLFQHFDTP